MKFAIVPFKRVYASLLNYIKSYKYLKTKYALFKFESVIMKKSYTADDDDKKLHKILYCTGYLLKK